MEFLNELPAGLAGLVLAVIVLGSVFLSKRAGLIVTGEHARLANVLLAGFLTYQTQDISEVESALVFLLASLASAGTHELIEWLRSRKDGAAG
jgi:hypothetical protein